MSKPSIFYHKSLCHVWPQASHTGEAAVTGDTTSNCNNQITTVIIFNAQLILIKFLLWAESGLSASCVYEVGVIFFISQFGKARHRQVEELAWSHGAQVSELDCEPRCLPPPPPQTPPPPAPAPDNVLIAATRVLQWCLLFMPLLVLFLTQEGDRVMRAL